MRQWMRVAGVTVAAVGLLACSEDGPRGVQAGADAATTGDAAPGGDAGEPQGDAAADAASLAALPNACDADADCARGACRSGVCIEDPPPSAVGGLDDPGTGLPSATAVDLGCADRSLEIPETPDRAAMVGALARFGTGRNTTGLQVDVLLADGFDPTPCEAETDEEAQLACYRGLGPVIGTATTVAREGHPELPSVCSAHEECPYGFQCYDPAKLGGKCEPQFGVYRIEDLPLDTPLIIRSRAVSATDQSRWHDTWMFHVVLSSGAMVDGAVHYDAQIVSEPQWLLTTNSVGLGDIPPENGAIGGRVRDCQQADRPAWPIHEVRVGLARPAEKVVYFNNLEDDTVPLVDRQTTHVHGRYAALNIEAGWNVISGSVRLGDAVRSVGSIPVYVFPNALSIASWPGVNPHWRQKN
jgi:hypothetical protein